MNRILLSVFLSLTTLYSFADTQKEITHLLDFVEKTDCSYNRNGTIHTGVEAREHIQKKLEYYQEKIKTAEEFVDYAATKSMITGHKYIITCANSEDQFSHDWLNNELKSYRSKMIEK